MQIKINVTGKSGCSVQHVADVQQEGELSNAIAEALDEFRRTCGETTFDSTIRIEHA